MLKAIPSFEEDIHAVDIDGEDVGEAKKSCVYTSQRDAPADRDEGDAHVHLGHVRRSEDDAGCPYLFICFVQMASGEHRIRVIRPCVRGTLRLRIQILFLYRSFAV